MRLLFDENLSPDLPRLLAAVFPGSVHVRDLGLVGADDDVVWRVAATQEFVVVTKDDDFLELAILRGAPPKVVVIGLGNCRTSAVVSLLRAKKPTLEQFEREANASLLELPEFSANPNGWE